VAKSRLRAPTNSRLLYEMRMTAIKQSKNFFIKIFEGDRKY